MPLDRDASAALRDLGNQLGEMIQAHTFAPQLGAVWAAMLLLGDDASIDSIAIALDEEAGDVETWCEELVEIGAAQVLNDGFCAERDPLAIAMHFVRSRELAVVNETIDALLHVRDKLKRSQSANAKQAQQHVEELARHAKLIQKVLDAAAQSTSLKLDKLLSALSNP
jgi:DNA-binding transcriptional regulator GbsR (MarR family)